MSPIGIVEAPLNPDKIRLGFSKFEGKNLIFLITDTCKRSVELPESTEIHLTLNLLILNVRIRASRCCCNIQLESTREKMITPSIRRVLLLVNPGRMELTSSCTEVARSNPYLFRLELYSSLKGPLWI